MKKIFYILIINYTLLSAFGGVNCLSQWVTQNSGTTQHLLDISMINKDTGWVSGANGTILKTTDGGTNWVLQITNIIDRIETIFFINANTGWAATRVTGKIIKTTNGGNNWTLIFQSSRASFNSIFFLDSLNGWTAGVGIPNQCFRTTNGGNTWDSVSIYPVTGNQIYFFNRMDGIIAIGPYLFKSTSGGKQWDTLYVSPAGEITDFTFINQNTGWFTNSSYGILKTVNAGLNWNQLVQLTGATGAHSIFFSSINTGWVCGDIGYLFKSENSGLNWYQQQTNTNNFLNQVQFVTDSLGWCVGGVGRIIYTNNGGQVLGVEQTGNAIPKDFILYQNYPNPFNSNTIIEFDIRIKGEYEMKVLDITGKVTEELFNKSFNPGKYKFLYDANKLSTGVYFYSLKGNKQHESRKFILIK